VPAAQAEQARSVLRGVRSIKVLLCKGVCHILRRLFSTVPNSRGKGCAIERNVLRMRGSGARVGTSLRSTRHQEAQCEAESTAVSAKLSSRLSTRQNLG
jgi:hypothetical protein